jgi:hypothetical protein
MTTNIALATLPRLTMTAGFSVACGDVGPAVQELKELRS